MRVAFVDLDRIHTDPGDGDHRRHRHDRGGTVTRGTTVTTTSLGHVVVGLRHLLMGCNASVSQYGAPDPDPSKDALGILNSRPDPSARRGGDAAPSSARTSARCCSARRSFVRDVLTTPDGHGRQRRDARGRAVDARTPARRSLESQGAALRVLVEAWFLTQDTTLPRSRAGRRPHAAHGVLERPGAHVPCAGRAARTTS